MTGIGTWDAATANWAGAGSTWGDGNDTVFNNTATPTTVTLSGAITATSVLLGNSTAANNNGNYSLIGGTLNDSETLVVQGNATNGATYTSNPAASINSALAVSGSPLIGRANLNITGGSYTTSRFTANPASVDWATLTISGGNVTATNGIDGTNGGNGTNGSTATFQLNLNGGTFELVSLTTSLVKAGALGFTLSNVTDGSYALFSGTAPTGSFASVRVGGSPLTDQGAASFRQRSGASSIHLLTARTSWTSWPSPSRAPGCSWGSGSRSCSTAGGGLTGADLFQFGTSVIGGLKVRFMGGVPSPNRCGK